MEGSPRLVHFWEIMPPSSIMTERVHRPVTYHDPTVRIRLAHLLEFGPSALASAARSPFFLQSPMDLGAETLHALAVGTAEARVFLGR